LPSRAQPATTEVVVMSEQQIEQALCDMVENTLIAKGIDASTAVVIAEAGCAALVKPAGRLVRRRGARAASKVVKKVKRKASAYSKEVGRQLKKLKKKHPRTPIPKLMKRAHAAAKRARK